MLYRTPQLDATEMQVISRIEKARHALRHYLSEPRRWNGVLARITRARAIRASNSIEGIHVSAEDAIAAVDHEDPTEADKETWQAIVGYRQAMDFILQRVRDDNFKFSLDMVLAAHFMITQYDLDSNPGNFRPGWVCVRNSATGDIVHEGADRDQLEGLMQEYVESLNVQSPEVDRMVHAAMAHLNMVMIHPFSDGNGRIARCIQSAILANDGIIAPIFSSIEEYIGKNTDDYYKVLARVGGGKWDPRRDAKPWIRFCLTAHYRQAQTSLQRLKEIERIADEIWLLIERKGLSERMGYALVEAAMGYRVRNASYRVSADINPHLASRDLKAMVDIGLLEKKGEKRGTVYTPSLELQKISARHHRRKEIPDPFTLKDDEEDKRQASLFDQEHAD